MMEKTLLERFDIPIPRSFDDVNLIGIDNGDGEISACLASWTMKQERFTLQDLKLDPADVKTKLPNAYWISPNEQRFVLDASESELTRGDNGLRYYNFKRCPGTPESKERFVKDDREEDARSYEEVMSLGFGVAVRALYEKNPLVIDRNKPSIILVGRPSSVGWAQHEAEYAKLLEEGLKGKLRDITQCPVRVAVQSESWAALARETDPHWGGIKRGEVVLILDNGSSTFDVTAIQLDGLTKGGAGEDSFQFGGNQLDNNLLQLLRQEAERQYPGVEFQSKHGHKLGLRIKKEEYYGEYGDARQVSVYSVTLSGVRNDKGKAQKLLFHIDEDMMARALNEMPVSVFHYERSIGPMILKRRIDCASWLSACRTVYESFYRKLSPLFTKPGDAVHPKIPDRVILSGGVSVMPEARALVTEVFGVEPVITNLPNYSVSQGLAYVLGCEAQKAIYLQKLLKWLKETALPDAKSLRSSIIGAGADEDWDAMRKAMENWADAPRDCAISGWTEYYRKEFNPNLDLPVQEGARRWYQNNRLERVISEKLQAQFKRMFPEYADAFQYTLPPLPFDSLNGVQVTIQSDWDYFFGAMTADEDERVILSENSRNRTRSRDWRQNAFRHFLSLENSVRSGGVQSVHYSRKGFLGGAVDAVFGKRHTDISYPGLASMYGEKISVKAAEGIRNEIYALLAGQMKEYVELITPYFNMTSRKE